MNIPGYRESIERECRIRREAMQRLPIYIAGIEVRRPTLADLDTLEAVRSPFVTGGSPPTPEDVASFLWLMSRAFARVRKVAPFLTRLCAKRFMRRCRRLPFLETVGEIDAYLDEQLMDAPGSRMKGGGDPVVNGTASIIAYLARRFGWSREAILSLPVVEVNQYIRCNQMAEEEKPVFFNKFSGRAKSKWLKEQNSKNS